MEKTKRAPKGEASIVVRSGRLFLLIPQFAHPERRRAEIALDMADSEAGQIAAAQVLARLRLDIYSGNFDLSLEKYKSQPVKKLISVYELWCEYVDYRRGTVKATTIHYYEEIIGHRLRDCPQSLANELGVRKWLLKNMSQAYASRVLAALSWAVNWGIQHKRIDLDRNLYTEMAKQTKPRNQPPEPNAFNDEEKEAILNNFLTSHHYDYYYPFVYFLFLTGCRPSEAIGLRRGDIDDDFKKIKFCGSIVQIKSQATWMEKSKNNRVRFFPINGELRDLLEACLKDKPDPDFLVFPSRENPLVPMDYINFSHRAWKTVDQIVGRKTTPYSCRDTFITEQIAKGTPIAVVARWVDNSPDIIDKHYFDISAVQFMPQ
jgi:integrase